MSDALTVAAERLREARVQHEAAKASLEVAARIMHDCRDTVLAALDELSDAKRALEDAAFGGGAIEAVVVDA